MSTHGFKFQKLQQNFILFDKLFSIYFSKEASFFSGPALLFLLSQGLQIHKSRRDSFSHYQYRSRYLWVVVILRPFGDTLQHILLGHTPLKHTQLMTDDITITPHDRRHHNYNSWQTTSQLQLMTDDITITTHDRRHHNHNSWQTTSQSLQHTLTSRQHKTI